MPEIIYENVDINDTIDEIWSVSVKNEDKNSYTKIADFDSFLSLDGKHESQVVQNAIEKGHFRSVNKIRKPDVFTIELAKGGNSQDIQLVLKSLKKYKNSTDLLTITTPFGSMEDMNLISLDYSFKQGGAVYMLIARLTLQEIQSGNLALEYTSAVVKNPDDTNTQDVGEKVPKEVE